MISHNAQRIDLAQGSKVQQEQKREPVEERQDRFLLLLEKLLSEPAGGGKHPIETAPQKGRAQAAEGTLHGKSSTARAEQRQGYIQGKVPSAPKQRGHVYSDLRFLSGDRAKGEGARDVLSSFSARKEVEVRSFRDRSRGVKRSEDPSLSGRSPGVLKKAEAHGHVHRPAADLLRTFTLPERKGKPESEGNRQPEEAARRSSGIRAEESGRVLRGKRMAPQAAPTLEPGAQRMEASKPAQLREIKNEPEHGRELLFASEKYEQAVLKQVGKTSYQIPGNSDEIFNDIVRHLSLVAKKGGGEAHIVLRPDFLGSVKLDLRLEGREVQTLVLVDNQAVKDLILSRLTVLEQGLLQQGFSLGSFQVEVKDSGPGFQTKRREPEGREGARPVESAQAGQEAAGAAGAVLPWISTYVDVTV